MFFIKDSALFGRGGGGERERDLILSILIQLVCFGKALSGCDRVDK